MDYSQMSEHELDALVDKIAGPQNISDVKEKLEYVYQQDPDLVNALMDKISRGR